MGQSCEAMHHKGSKIFRGLKSSNLESQVPKTLVNTISAAQASNTSHFFSCALATK